MLLEIILFASIPGNDNCNLIMKLRTLILALFIIAYNDYHTLIYFLLLGIFLEPLTVDETDALIRYKHEHKMILRKVDLAAQVN